jgi:hypothetical protein
VLEGGLAMARKSFARTKLESIQKNKRKLKAALARLPRAPPVAGLPGRAYNLAITGREPLVDASSIAFQNELLLRRLVDLENNLMDNRREIEQPSIVRELLKSVPETVDAGEGILMALSEEDLGDTELIDAIIEDVQTGRDVIRDSRQFSRANIVGGINLEAPKRTRRKTKTDKNMSKALRLANERFRKKNGQIRKGATQAQIMKYAHKLLRKM